MASLPHLSRETQQINKLKFQILAEDYGFNGEQYGWKSSPDHVAKALEDRGQLRKALSIRSTASERQKAKEVLNELIGVDESSNFGKQRFRDLAELYLSLWVEESRTAEDFEEWLGSIQSIVEKELFSFWCEKEDLREWFDRALRKKLKSDLLPIRREYLKFARTIKIKHLENPEISLESLYRARGDIKLSHLLDEGDRALEKARGIGSKIQSDLEHKATSGENHRGSQKATGRKRPTRKPDMVRHNEIAEVVGKHDPHWRTKEKQWRSDEVLEKVCKDLDDSLVPVPSNWTSAQRAKQGRVLETWVWAFEIGEKRLVRENISYSLQKIQESEASAKN